MAHHEDQTEFETTVHIWKKAGMFSPGHASLRLDDDTYLSWWPGHRKIWTLLLGTPNPCKNLREDVHRMGRDPDNEYTVLLKHHRKCLKRWEQIRAAAEYELFGTNCCWMVYEFLYTGGAPYRPYWLWYPAVLKTFMEEWKHQAPRQFPFRNNEGVVSDPTEDDQCSR